MTDKKMVRGNVTLLAAFPEAVADWTKPTSAELNKLFTFDAANVDNMVFNISCAIEDGYTLGLTDPSTTSKRSVCDVSEVQTPTYDNYEASFDLFRDEDQTAEGLYNMARELFLGPDIVFVMIERIGKSNSAVRGWRRHLRVPLPHGLPARRRRRQRRYHDRHSTQGHR